FRSLTGLLNRRGFRLRSEALLATLEQDAPIGLLAIDLDRFKRINDRFGHLVGDQAIGDTGRLFQAALPGRALAARLGGEEFVVLLTGADAGGAADLAERLRAVVAARPLQLADSAVLLTVSIGVAWARAPLPTLRPLLLRADEALYQAKAAGRDCCVVAPGVIGSMRIDGP